MSGNEVHLKTPGRPASSPDDHPNTGTPLHVPPNCLTQDWVLELNAGAISVGATEVRDFFIKNCFINDDRGDWATRIELVFSEWLTNIFRHGYHAKYHSTCRITAWGRPGFLQLLIQDTGIPFDPVSYLRNRGQETPFPESADDEMIEDLSEGGRGILIIGKIMTMAVHRDPEWTNSLILKRQWPEDQVRPITGQTRYQHLMSVPPDPESTSLVVTALMTCFGALFPQQLTLLQARARCIQDDIFGSIWTLLQEAQNATACSPDDADEAEEMLFVELSITPTTIHAVLGLDPVLDETPKHGGGYAWCTSQEWILASCMEDLP